jgi:hypothetical protein
VKFKEAYDSFQREVLYSILVELLCTMKIVKVIKVCLNATYSNVSKGKNLSDAFHIQKVLKQGDVFSQLLLNFSL